MKLKHLSTAFLLSILVNHGLQAASYTAEGVNSDNLINSPRFYDSGKGFYWNYQALHDGIFSEYSQAGSDFSFLGNLSDRVNPPSKTYGNAYSLNYSNWHAYLKDDSSTCWYHTSSNLIQYWQSYYGVFAANPEALPYGLTYSRSASAHLGGTQSLEVGMFFYDTVKNTGGNLLVATDYYFSGGNLSNVTWDYWTDGERVTQVDATYNFKRDSVPVGATYADSEGGFFKDYFPAALTEGSLINNLTAKSVAFNANDKAAGQSLLTAMGCSMNNGEIKRETVGQLAYVSLSSGGSIGHAITCYGFELNDDGSIKSIQVTNSDDLKFDLFTLNVGADGTLYDENGNLWTYSDKTWAIKAFEYINTPAELVQMYADYSSQKTNLEWNGTQSVWSEQYTSSTDALPSASTGWEVKVASDTNPTAPPKYYNTYYSDSRSVEFGDYGETSTDITVDGAVKASDMLLAASENNDYTFTGSDNQTENSITIAGTLQKTGESVDSISNLEMLADALSLSAGELCIAADASLTARTGKVSSGSILALSSTASASIGNLAIETKGALEVESGASFTGQLTMAQGSVLVFDLSEYSTDAAALSFSGTLTLSSTINLLITGLESMVSLSSADAMSPIALIQFSTPQEFDADFIKTDYGNVIYDDANSILYYSIPEPTTAMLSLLSLLGLTVYRRR